MKTYEDISNMLGCRSGSLKTNYARNKSLFIDGKDFISISGIEAQKYAGNAKVRSVKLFTTSGVITLARMLKDNSYAVKYLKSVGVPTIAPSKEAVAIVTIEQVLSIKLERQVTVGRFRIDAYDRQSNTVYEIDEYHHVGTKGEDKARQDEIEAILKCKFVRIVV